MFHVPGGTPAGRADRPGVGLTVVSWWPPTPAPYRAAAPTTGGAADVHMDLATHRVRIESADVDAVLLADTLAQAGDTAVSV